MIRYEMFKEVEDCGQKRIGSRGMVTQKGKADGGIAQVTGQLVAKGFLEDEKLKSDYLTMLRDLLKLYFALLQMKDSRLEVWI